MDTIVLIASLEVLGVSVQVNGNSVQLEPYSKVPDYLREECRAHTANIVELLRAGLHTGEQPSGNSGARASLSDCSPDAFSRHLEYLMQHKDPAEIGAE